MLHAILSNIFTILSVAFAVILVYSLRSTKNEFVFLEWLKTNVNRFMAGAVLGVLISVLMVVSPEIDALFAVIGFNATKTPVSIGLALGALLIAMVSGIKTNAPPSSEEKL